MVTLKVRNNVKENLQVNKKYKRSIFDIPEVGVVIPLIALIIIITSIKPEFLSISNISAIFTTMVFIGIVAIGQTLVILVSEIDASVGSVAGVGAIISTFLMIRTNIGVIPSIIVALILCAVIGLVNGIFIIKLKIPAFIATISMLYVARGIAMLITKGYPIYPLPNLFILFGEVKPLGISIFFLLLIFLIIVFEIILRKTNYGRSIYAIGNNKDVAKLSGINVERIKISAFVLCSVFSGLAGICFVSQLKSGMPNTGTGWELQAIAATAIGGISLAGGAGTIIGAFIGVIILAVLSNGLVFIGTNTFIQGAITGIIMILAVMVDVARKNRKLRY